MRKDSDFWLGVNYWPAKKGMGWWKDFDESEVKNDFKRIKDDLGLDYVRIFLMWDDFQPKPDETNKESLEKLGKVLDTARENDLKVMPTILTGHMSGINWLPEWALSDKKMNGKEKSRTHKQISGGKYTDRKLKDMYSDPFMLNAETRFIKDVVGTYADHSAICGWDLSNGCTHVQKAKDPATERSWNNKLYHEIKKYDPKHPVTLGAPTFLDDKNNKYVSRLNSCNDLLSVHAYPLFVDYVDDLDPDFAPFLVSLMRGLTGKKRPVLLQEFGVCTVPQKKGTAHDTAKDPGVKKDVLLAREGDAAKYYGEVLKRSYEAGASGAWAWCYSDYDRSLYGKPPFDSVKFERHFGLLRADGSLKPAAAAMKEFKKKLENGEIERRENDYAIPEKYLSRLMGKDGYGRKELESAYKGFKAARKN